MFSNLYFLGPDYVFHMVNQSNLKGMIAFSKHFKLSANEFRTHVFNINNNNNLLVLCRPIVWDRSTSYHDLYFSFLKILLWYLSMHSIFQVFLLVFHKHMSNAKIF